MKRRRRTWAVAAVFLAFAFAWAAPAMAGDVQVAVAANFAAPAQRIADAFAKDTGDHATIVTGATGKLRAQIENGAPFEVLLAADDAAPATLETEKLAVPGTRFTYAIGKLVLWSAKPNFVDPAGAVLRQGHFEHLAIANPKLAPYGAAAMQVLEALGLATSLAPKLVQGENIGQAAQFVASGSAELGFVALSQAAPPDLAPAGSYWLVPAALYAPLRQDAVLLQRAAASPAARAFLAYLKGAKAREVLRAYGYGLGDEPRAPSPAPSAR